MNKIDKLVVELTAFQSWKQMAEAMRLEYIPTLNGGKATSKLAEICRRNGFKVYCKGIVI